MTRNARSSLSYVIVVLGVRLWLAGCSNKSGRELDAADSNKPSRNDSRASPTPLTPFDTGTLKGSFLFFSLEGQQQRLSEADFAGIGECVYKPLGVPLVNKTRPNSLFLPEWILRPKEPRDGTLWRAAYFVMPEHICHGIRVRYLHQNFAATGLRCTLEYRAVRDMLLLDGYIEPTRSHTNLELMFASYLPNRLNATYVPAKVNGGIVWRKIPNRVEFWKSTYFIASSSETMRWHRDGRFSDATELGDWSAVYSADWPFAAPVLVNIEESSGLAAITFVDDYCTTLVGQYHPNDTAHDFTWGFDSLKPGQKIHTRAALWITQLKGTHEERMRRVYKRYQSWRRSWAK